MDKLTLQPASLAYGDINLPGSKSVSNRALLLAAMAKGTTQITNLLDSDDIHYMLQALQALGVKYTLSADKTQCQVEGIGGPLIKKQGQQLYLGNAGTAMRPLTAALALSDNEVTLTGEPRMKQRPIGHLVDALQQGGAKVGYLENLGFPPISINGGFIGGDISVDGSLSSQFLTALLMAAPLALNDTNITIIGDLVSKPYIDITLAMMRDFGVEVQNNQYHRFTIKGQQNYLAPKCYLVEGDASSASYFLAAAAIRGGKVRVTGIGKHSVQGDIHFADYLEKMGANIIWGDDFIECSKGELTAIDCDMNTIPDAAMTLAVVALFAKGTTTLRNIYNWRVKETDRLSAMATELRKVGATVEEGEDFISITPPRVLQHANIETYNDHRMAMCFSLASLGDVPMTILDPGCTAKTFPNYFAEFEQLTVWQR